MKNTISLFNNYLQPTASTHIIQELFDNSLLLKNEIDDFAASTRITQSISEKGLLNLEIYAEKFITTFNSLMSEIINISFLNHLPIYSNLFNYDELSIINKKTIEEGRALFKPLAVTDLLIVENEKASINIPNFLKKIQESYPGIDINFFNSEENIFAQNLRVATYYDSLPFINYSINQVQSILNNSEEVSEIKDIANTFLSKFSLIKKRAYQIENYLSNTPIEEHNFIKNEIDSLSKHYKYNIALHCNVNIGDSHFSNKHERLPEESISVENFVRLLADYKSQFVMSKEFYGDNLSDYTNEKHNLIIKNFSIYSQETLGLFTNFTAPSIKINYYSINLQRLNPSFNAASFIHELQHYRDHQGLKLLSAPIKQILGNAHNHFDPFKSHSFLTQQYLNKIVNRLNNTKNLNLVDFYANNIASQNLLNINEKLQNLNFFGDADIEPVELLKVSSSYTKIQTKVSEELAHLVFESNLLCHLDSLPSTSIINILMNNSSLKSDIIKTLEQQINSSILPHMSIYLTKEKKAFDFSEKNSIRESFTFMDLSDPKASLVSSQSLFDINSSLLNLFSSLQSGLSHPLIPVSNDQIHNLCHQIFHEMQQPIFSQKIKNFSDSVLLKPEEHPTHFLTANSIHNFYVTAPVSLNNLQPYLKNLFISEQSQNALNYLGLPVEILARTSEFIFLNDINHLEQPKSKSNSNSFIQKTLSVLSHSFNATKANISKLTHLKTHKDKSLTTIPNYLQPKVISHDFHLSYLKYQKQYSEALETLQSNEQELLLKNYVEQEFSKPDIINQYNNNAFMNLSSVINLLKQNQDQLIMKPVLDNIQNTKNVFIRQTSSQDISLAKKII